MNAIRRIRTQILGMTQAAFAARVGVRQSTVSNWETGKWSPRLDDITRIIDSSDGKVAPHDFLRPAAPEANPVSPATEPVTMGDVA